MLIAFIAVVSVQWIWMKYSMREGEARFTSKVYDVLGKAVNLVEQTNNIRLFNDLKERYTQVEEVISTMNLYWRMKTRVITKSLFFRLLSLKVRSEKGRGEISLAC